MFSSLYKTITSPSNISFLHFSLLVSIPLQSRDSSVSIALGYGLDDRGSRVRFPAGARNFSPHYRIQNGSGAHPASYPMATGGSFPGGKAATHPHLVSRSRMRGGIPPLPNTSSWRGA
jgi:hypothetical protein